MLQEARGIATEGTMRVWITKWAETPDPEFPEYLSYNYATLRRGDWHPTREEAVSKANEMKRKKLISLRKAIDKVEGMTF